MKTGRKQNVFIIRYLWRVFIKRKREGLESMTTSHFLAVNPRGATHIISVTRLDHEETFPRVGGYLGQNHSIPTKKFSTPPVISYSAVQFHMKMKQIYFN